MGKYQPFGHIQQRLVDKKNVLDKEFAKKALVSKMQNIRHNIHLLLEREKLMWK